MGRAGAKRAPRRTDRASKEERKAGIGSVETSRERARAATVGSAGRMTQSVNFMTKETAVGEVERFATRSSVVWEVAVAAAHFLASMKAESFRVCWVVGRGCGLVAREVGVRVWGTGVEEMIGSGRREEVCKGKRVG